MGEDKTEGGQSGPGPVAPLLQPLAALQQLLESFEKPGVIIGGVAASLIGKPRLTADIDALVLLNLDNVNKLISAAETEGIILRIENGEEFARKNRVLLMQHQASGINIDISLGMLPFEAELIDRSRIHRFGGLDLRLPTPEDLIIMKAVAHRPRDLEDIQSIAETNPGLDVERIRLWVDLFGEALDQPELWGKVRELLK